MSTTAGAVGMAPCLVVPCQVESSRSLSVKVADVESSLSFAGEGPGLLAGTLAGNTAVVGRWHGSGLREGRVVFTLRANASGIYTLPVRFVLSTRS